MDCISVDKDSLTNLTFTMFSLFLRNLFFTILQPGLVAGLIPYLILGVDIKAAFIQPSHYNHYLGTIFFILGFTIMLSCIIGFAVKGYGTLSPADPTRRLVRSGLYKLSRNPMYLGVIMLLIGEAIFFQSIYLWLYSILIFLAFHFFILFSEEPRLRKDFGEEYGEYCNKVRRWF